MIYSSGMQFFFELKPSLLREGWEGLKTIAEFIEWRYAYR